jgi:hypothetical protein
VFVVVCLLFLFVFCCLSVCLFDCLFVCSFLFISLPKTLKLANTTKTNTASSFGIPVE